MLTVLEAVILGSIFMAVALGGGIYIACQHYKMKYLRHAIIILNAIEAMEKHKYYFCMDGEQRVRVCASDFTLEAARLRDVINDL